ncbi:hypothetical protein [Sphingomonas sp. M1-B02]|uniref:hypothetical protein n=1 Tax=Sphingomonas sp. M1-B02 TaxID=3114300 RepID=UPI002240D3EC|nr:hypothetical protein [Sphingomonas sp. S6-11]UZK64770.1 hypothetical protein OKW87_09505 [Sphingomonas sp. S6-11]
MILPLLLLLAQDMPATQAVEEQDIVVRATYGLTTMLFDKGGDGKLRNCRIMVSSGSSRRDTAACEATPVCYAATAEKVPDCVALTAIAPGVPPPSPAKGTEAVFDMPGLAQPKPADPAAIGPSIDQDESRETARQRVKLPPLPKAPSSGAVIRINNGADD